MITVHLSGKYRGAAHQICNAFFRKTKFVHVKFNNLSAYDAHLFVKNLNTMGEGDIDCIPNTEEKYIVFMMMKRNSNTKFGLSIVSGSCQQVLISGSAQQVLINLRETSNRTNLNIREKHSAMSVISC